MFTGAFGVVSYDSAQTLASRYELTKKWWVFHALFAFGHLNNCNSLNGMLPCCACPTWQDKTYSELACRCTYLHRYVLLWCRWLTYAGALMRPSLHLQDCHCERFETGHVLGPLLLIFARLSTRAEQC